MNNNIFNKNNKPNYTILVNKKSLLSLLNRLYLSGITEAYFFFFQNLLLIKLISEEYLFEISSSIDITHKTDSTDNTVLYAKAFLKYDLIIDYLKNIDFSDEDSLEISLYNKNIKLDNSVLLAYLDGNFKDDLFLKEENFDRIFSLNNICLKKIFQTHAKCLNNSPRGIYDNLIFDRHKNNDFTIIRSSDTIRVIEIKINLTYFTDENFLFSIKRKDFLTICKIFSNSENIEVSISDSKIKFSSDGFSFFIHLDKTNTLPEISNLINNYNFNNYFIFNRLAFLKALSLLEMAAKNHYLNHYGIVSFDPTTKNISFKSETNIICVQHKILLIESTFDQQRDFPLNVKILKEILECFSDETLFIEFDSELTIGKPIIIKSNDYDIMALLTTFDGIE